MSTTPDPKTVREIARSAFGYLPHDYVRARLVQAALAEHGIDEHDIPTWSAYFDAAKADLAGAVVSWLDEQPQEFACEVCTKPITAYPCVLCEHEPDPWNKCGRHCAEMHTYEPGQCELAPKRAEQPQDERDGEVLSPADVPDEWLQAAFDAIGHSGTGDGDEQMRNVLAAVVPLAEQGQAAFGEIVRAAQRRHREELRAERQAADDDVRAVRALTNAASRMLGMWAEANDDVRRELWTTLHDRADDVHDRFRERFAELDAKAAGQ